MKKCIRHSQTNDKPSKLYETIYDNIANGNELEADLLYSYFNSAQFINIFGDYVEAFKDGKPLDNTDENGEPLLQLDEESGEYYFVSKYGDRIKYPLNNNGLITTMSSADIVVAVENISKEFFTSLGNDISVDQLNFESDTSLDKFIEDLLNKKKSEARASKNKLAYVNFNTLLNHIPELKSRVSKHFDKLGLSLIDNETEDATLINNDGENEARDYSFNTSSFEKSSLNNISKEIKLRLSFIENTNLPTNYWGTHPLLGMGVAYNTISENLANIPNIDENFQTVDVFNLQLERLRKLSEQNPAYEGLYLEMLQLQDKVDNKFRNDFATTFNKATNNFIRVFVTLDDKKGTSVNYTNMSKTGGATKAELNTMTYDLYSKFTDKTVNKPFEDSNVRLTEIANKLSELKQTFVSDDKGYLSFRSDFIKLLGDLGITTNDTEIEHVVSKNNSIVDIDERASEINKMVIDLSNMVSAMKTNFENDVDNRKLLNSISTLHDIAKAKAFFKGESSELSIRIGQKNRYVMSNPSFIQQHVNNLKSVPGYAEYKLNQSAYTKGSYYLQYYTANEARGSRRMSAGARKRASEQRLSKLDVQVFTAAIIKEGFKSAESLDGSEMRMQDYLISQINATFDPNGAMKTSTPADKSTDRQIVTGIPRFENVLSSKEERLQIDNNVLYIFRNYFMSEFMRMREAAREVKNAAESIRLSDDKEAAYNEAIKGLTVHYHFNEKKGLPFDKEGNILFKNLGNAFKSQLFPVLSFDENRDTTDGSIASRIHYILYGNQEMTQDNFMFNEFTSINDSFNNPDFYNATDYEGNRLDALLGEYINNVLINRILKLNDILIKEDIIVKNVEDGTIDTKRTKIDKNLLNAKLSKYTDAIMVHPSQFDLALTTDYLINNMIHLIEYSKMFAGDFAYYKNMDDYHKRVPATYTDGILPNFGDANPTFNVAVASTVNIRSSVYNQLVEMLGEEGAKPYENINAADAQAWITPQRWKVLMQSKWTPVHESVYKKMLSKKPVTFTQEELLAAAQPLKGVYFEINNGVPTYMKYSQAVLSPHLVNNNPGLENLLKSMEEQGVDELVTSDAFKVGSPVSTVVHNPDGSFKDNLQFNVKTISSTGWKLQQDLPTKTFKELNVGSQIQKNIFAGLLFNQDVQDFKLDSEDKTITGKEVINRIVKATKFLSDHGYDSVLREFGIDENGKITNRSRYFEAITDELREAGHEFAAKALERGLSPYAIPSIGTKMDQMFASILTKRIVKIQTNGASLIQMSNVGFSKHEGDGIMWAPDVESGTVPYEPHFVKDKDGNTVLGDNGKPLIKPAGVLISGSFLAKYIPDYEKYNTPDGLKELFGYTDEDGNFVRGMIDKNILNKIIGYRIPNQGLASNDAMEIIGILPATQGDTIVAYTGVTTKTGSDFDIDKMFIMMPSFRYDTYIPRKDAKTVFDNIVGREGKNRKTFLQDVEFFLNEYDVELENSSFLYSDDKYTSEEADELWSEMTTALIRLAKKPKNAKIAKAFGEIGVDVKEITNLRYIKPVGEMTKAKAQNLLIESYKATLLSNSNIKEVMRPIDDDTIKNEMLRNKHADSNEYSQSSSDLYHVDPYHDVELMYSFRKGKLGVGQEANQMVDVNRMGKLILNRINLGRGHYSDSDKGMILDQQFSEELSVDELAVFFKEAKEYHKLFSGVKMSNTEDILQKTNNFDNAYIRENFSAELADKVESIRKMNVATVYTSLLNGFVDIAKDSFITDANWVAATTNPGNFLIRAGVHPIWVVNFIGQPVIKKYIDFMSSSSEYGEIYNNFMKSLIEDNVKGDKSVEFKHSDPRRGIVTTTVTVKNILDKIMLSSKQDSDIIRTLLDNNDWLLGEVVNDNSTRNRLLNDATFMSDFSKIVDNIKEIYQKSLSAPSVTELPSLVDLKNNSKNSTIDNDLQIISFFRDVQGYSKNLNDIMKILKVDTDGLSGSLSNISAMEESVNMILANENEPGSIKGLYSKLNNTITGVYYDNVRRLKHIVSNNNDLFPHLSDNVQEVFKEISKGIDGTALTDMELAKQIERSFQVYTLDKFFGINTSQQVYDLLAKFPQEFEDFKNRLKEEDRLSEYPLLENLFLESSINIYANPRSGENVTIFNNANSRTPFRISTTSNKKSESETLDMIASWSRLYAEDKPFASKLIEYAYLVSGFEVGPREFFQYIPQEYFIDNKFNDDLAVTLSDPSSFGNMFFENNSDNYKAVRNIPRFNEILNTGFKATSYGGVLHVDEHDKIVRPYLNYNEKSGDMVNEKLLKFVGLDHRGNRVYVNVPKRGLRSRDLNFKLVNYSDNTVNPSERIFRTRNEDEYYANKDRYASARTTALQAVSTLPESSIFNDEDSSLQASREGVTVKNKQVKEHKSETVVRDQQIVTDLSGNNYNVSENEIITYNTESGDIRYIVDNNGDMVMLKDDTVEFKEIKTPILKQTDPSEMINNQTDLAKNKLQSLKNNSKRFELSERTVKADEGGEVNIKESVYLNTETKVPYSRVTKMLSTKRNYIMEDFSFLDINNAFNVSKNGIVTIDDNVFDAIQTLSNNSSELTDPTTVHRHKRINDQYPTMLRLKSATIVGNKLDDIVRDFFSGKSIEETLNSLTTSEDVKGQIRQALDVLQTYFRNRGETVYTQDIMFYNDTFGVAGTPDIVTVDKQGVYRIYDLKTNKDIFTFDKQYEELDVEGDVVKTIDPETGERVSVLQPTKLDKYNKQLNTYRILMNNTHGIAAAELKLIVFDMTYDGTNGRTDVINAKFSEDQIIDIPITDEVIPFGMEDAVNEAKSENLYDGLSISEKFNQFGVMMFDSGVTLDLSKTLDEGQEGSPGKLSMRKTMMTFAEQLESKYGADWQSRFKEGLQYYKASNNLKSISGSEFIDFLKKCSK